MLKAFKYKILPNDEQIVLLNKHFGSTRFIFNRFLNERRTEYETNKQTLNYNDNSASLTLLKQDENHIWLKEVNSQSLQFALKCLDCGYNNFFKKRGGFPKFKSKKDNHHSFCVPQSVEVIGDLLFIPKFKDGIKFIKHRDFNGKIRQCTLSKTPTNEFFVSILVETTHVVSPKTNKTIGIDLGLKDFVITSDGLKYKNNKYTKTYERKLKTEQQHLSKKTKGSNRYEKQRLKVAKIHKKITNSRNDNLHKVSTNLIKNYDVICLENLNIKGMIKNHKLAKHIADASWGKFIDLLTYKAEWNEKTIVHIDRFFPSSKSCNKCGYINQNLTLNTRMWTCPHCREKLDRDINASINILKEGLKIHRQGLSITDCGAKIRPGSLGTSYETSKIQEPNVLEANVL